MLGRSWSDVDTKHTLEQSCICNHWFNRLKALLKVKSLFNCNEHGLGNRHGCSKEAVIIFKISIDVLPFYDQRVVANSTRN